ncbi:hypothetical protein [Actomonas aquatica]|uniref:Uncharacterized protein n=1 Tax=Actomonas aquatica TaxID=2866162 RepID=A0ABZ1CCM1_9BACT|nr:hypothetical protein [Opitutus sp. WL0086]WRQ89395.1 hypothetical protein K1X11_008235 [Opitutus sp. WL0086]
MPLILAELSFDAVVFAGVMGSLGAAMWLYNEGRKAFGHNPPLHRSYVGREEYDRDQKDNAKRHDGAKESRDKMHNQLTDAKSEIAGLKANQTATNQWLHRIDTKIDQLLSQKR